MELPSVDYFCSTIRNDFLEEINRKEKIMESFLGNMISHFVEKNKCDLVTDILEKKITIKNKHILDYFFNRINQISLEIRKTCPLTQERVQILRNFCDELVENRHILKNFSYFNNSFIGMMIRFSREEIWGPFLSLEYFSKYFVN